MMNNKQPNYMDHSRSHPFLGWKPIRSALSVCVAAATVSSLILPAITLNQECQLQEHQHTEACYSNIEPQLACTYESMGVHVHEDSCYDDKKNLICGTADFIIHVHDDFCYDKAGALICQLPEVEAHQHDENCYELPEADPGHKHDENCYAWSYGENLVCTLEETQGHAHTDACYTPGHKHDENCYTWSYGESVVCELTEGPGHTHTEACYTPGHTHTDSCYIMAYGEAVICNEQESAGHTHSDGCYTKTSQLSCSLEESSGHPQHEEGCYDADGNLICQQEISEGHTHTDACYTETSELTCQTAESTGHTHSEACHELVNGELICETAESEPTLICGQQEYPAHTHNEACREKLQGELTCQTAECDPSLVCQQEESDAHSHIETCYEKIQGELTCTETEREPTAAEPNLICEKEEILFHLHTEECYADPEDLEEAADPLTAEAPEADETEIGADQAEESSAAEGAEAVQTDLPAENDQDPLTDDTVIPAEDTGEEDKPEENILICTKTVVDVHQHTEACFVVPEGPGCGLEEHLHINDCFPEREPPVEVQAEWEAALPAITGQWDADLAAIAMTQVGYAESTENRIADETGAIHGYTRYGHLAETPHAPWQTLFLSFCMHYAGIPQDAIPVNSDLTAWMEALSAAQLLRAAPVSEEPAVLSVEADAPSEETESESQAGEAGSEDPSAKETAEIRPQAGDLVFLDRDGDIIPESAAILVETTDEAGAAVLAAIEGDYEDAVTQLPYHADELKYFISLSQVRQAYLLAHPEIKIHERSVKGTDYTVTVRFGDAACLPEDVQLTVRELDYDSEEYQSHAAQIAAAEEDNEIRELRLFDISFLDAQGQEIEPAADVDVQILYDEKQQFDPDQGYSVVHFNEEKGMETPEMSMVADESGIQGYEFSLDSFSIIGTYSNTSTQTTNNKLRTTFKYESNVASGTLSMSDIGSDTALRTTDSVTMNDWKKFFGNDPNDFSTFNAGGIFNDKSVTAGSVTYNNGSISPDNDKFLVGLSTIGSTQSVRGLESAPTDVMFILDMSSSMYNGQSRLTATVDAMVTAVNESMEHLLENLSEHNRVGVVIYYGYHYVTPQSDNTHSFVMMPLGRYTADGNKYLQVDKDGTKLAGISTTSSLKKDGNTHTYDFNIADIAGTYAQAGILNAMDEFLKADTVVVDDDGKETARQPVFVFMSDGEPTAASVAFSEANAPTSSGAKRYADMGNNQVNTRHAAQSDFLTQLSIAYAKENVTYHYKEARAEGRPALLYALSLGNSISPDVMNPNFTNASDANHTKALPREATNESTKEDLTKEIRDYWNALIAAGSSGSVKLTAKAFDNSPKLMEAKDYFVKQTKLDDGSTFPSSTDQQLYTDGHYAAEDASDLRQAFGEIMLAISLQSKYSTTNIQNGDYQNTGNLSFVDTIGEHMTVTDVVGLIFNGTLYDGSNFANLLTTSSMGSMATGTKLGVGFRDVIETDFGIDTSTAARLIDAAYNVGQLSATTGSNYIEWYATMDAQGKHQYLGFSHKPDQDCGYGSGTHHTSPPEGAQYLIRSYFYYGDLETSETGTLSPSNLLYAQVWHRTRLSDGQESMLLALPAALLPTVDYQVGLDMDKNPIALTVAGAATPAMLLYEVGLNSTVTQNDVLPAVGAVTNAQAPVKGAVEAAIADYLATGTLAKTVTVNGEAYAIQWKMRANGETPELYSNGEPIPLAIASDAVGNNNKIIWDETGGMIALDKRNQPIAKAVHSSLLSGYHQGIQWKYTEGNGSYVQLGNNYYRPLAEVIYFYTNDFDTSNIYNASVNTFSYFQPNIQNDRYYYTGPVNEIEGSGTFIYDFEGDLIKYKPDSSSSSSDYFERFIYYTCIDGVKTEHIEWKPISRSALDEAVHDSNGYYYIPAGTPHDMTQSTAEKYVQHKSINRTGTQTFSDYPYIQTTGSYLIGSVQGNNGRLNIWPLKFTGTKSMSGVKDLSNYKFEFELYRTGSNFNTGGITPDQTVFNTGELGDQIEFANVWVTTVDDSYYVIREKKNDSAGVVFDETEYHIHVTLGGFEEGQPTFHVSWHKKGSDQKHTDLTSFNFSNKLGVELPETGGAGTELFILCGVAMMAAAVMIYLSKRKSFQGM